MPPPAPAGAATRYVRFYWPETWQLPNGGGTTPDKSGPRYGNYMIELADITVASTSGVVSRDGQVVRLSEQYKASPDDMRFTADKAIDDSLQTYCATTSSRSAFVELDLGRSVPNVNAVSIHGPLKSSESKRLNGLHVELLDANRKRIAGDSISLGAVPTGEVSYTRTFRF